MERSGITDAGRRVLVVDDDESLGRALRRFFRGRYRIEIATSSREALRFLERGERFEVILCDARMPQMDGKALYGELARSFPEQAARVVFASGGVPEEWGPDFLRALPNPCLEKPFDLARLEELLAAGGAPSPSPH
jgi:CheY-like chemotaxis protein